MTDQTVGRFTHSFECIKDAFHLADPQPTLASTPIRGLSNHLVYGAQAPGMHRPKSSFPKQKGIEGLPCP